MAAAQRIRLLQRSLSPIWFRGRNVKTKLIRKEKKKLHVQYRHCCSDLKARYRSFFLNIVPCKWIEQCNVVIMNRHGVVICVTCDVIRIDGNCMRSVKIDSCRPDHPL